MLVKTHAIVLNTLRYGDSQVIVTLFTESHGRLSFIQKASRSPRCAVKRQLFQPLTLLDVEFDYRPSRGLLRIKEASIGVPFVSLPFDPCKLSIALFLAEFTANGTVSEQSDRALYAFLYYSVRWIDACRGGFGNFHIVYMLHVTRFMGFYPDLAGYAPGACFDLRGGCFVGCAPSHADWLAPEEAGRIRTLMRLSYSTMHLMRLTREQRNRIVEVILHYYRLHVPSFPEMKSLPVLRELFA